MSRIVLWLLEVSTLGAQQLADSPDGLLAEFEEILAYSWANFPTTAERFGNAILNHVELLKRFPYIGSPVAGRRHVRKPVHTPIPYTFLIQEGGMAEWHTRQRCFVTAGAKQFSCLQNFVLKAERSSFGKTRRPGMCAIAQMELAYHHYNSRFWEASALRLVKKSLGISA